MSTTRSRGEVSEQRIAESIGRGARRCGYLLAAAINAVLLWVAHQLVDWGWPGFLTPEFDDLLPILTFSFVVSIVVNLVYAWSDAHPVKSLGEMATAAIGFAVALRTWRVFPFDFSDYDADWSWLVRMVLVVAMVGMAIGFIAQSVKLAEDLRRSAPSDEQRSRTRAERRGAKRAIRSCPEGPPKKENTP